ncbi:MAG: hypothetical protein ABIP94_06480 [Planctomycetota bacterium]
MIGVDMTPEMLARGAAVRMGIGNVEFGLGEIEHLPGEDGSIDVQPDRREFIKNGPGQRRRALRRVGRDERAPHVSSCRRRRSAA